MCESGVVSSTGERRWSPGTVVAVEVVAAHPRMAAASPPPPTVVPDLHAIPVCACNISL